MVMVRLISALFIAMLWSDHVLAEERGEVIEPAEIIVGAPLPKKETKPQAVETETITIYESKNFPGFRPCTPEDYRDQRYDPIACQDYEASRTMSTRDHDQQSRELIIENVVVPEAVVPQGNIYKLSFERFQKKKQ